MQKLYYIDEQVLELMKNEADKNLELYKQGQPWCEELLEVELQEIVKPIELKIEAGDKGKNDLANAILLYEAMKNLPYSVATNENFWAFLTHTVYWDYMRNRWPIEDAQQDEISYIHTRYMFSTKNKRFYRNGLSRLWFYAALTYDETNEENPYFYTELMMKNQDLAGLILETTSVSRNFKALKATLEIIKRLDELEAAEEIEKIKGKREFIRDVMKKINFIGAITIWDSLSHEEAVEKLWKMVSRDIWLIVK
ncbi:MAG: DUF6339 family protein [Solibacillus sp.]